MANARLFRTVVSARDASGNLTHHLGPLVYTGPRQTLQLTTNSPKIAGPVRLRRAGLGNRIETGVRGRVGVGGRLILRPSDTPLVGMPLRVIDPRGVLVARTRTSDVGTYRLGFVPKVSGTYRVLVEGERRAVRALKLFIRPQLKITTSPRSRLRVTAKRRDLVIPGELKAGVLSGSKRIQLQQRVGKRWRNVASDFTNADGRFALVYRPRLGAKERTLIMRARVAADPGRAYSPRATKTFKVTVAAR